VKRGGLIARFRGEREFNVSFIGRRRVWFLISAVAIGVSVFGLLVPQLDLGIDFRGGAILRYPNEAELTSRQVRQALAEFGREDAVVQLADEGREINVRTGALGDQRGELIEAMAAQAGIQPGEISIDDVGPRWGRQISQRALQGLLVFLVVVSLYIAMRFEWKMAIAGLAALFHDLIITGGVYALSGRDVTPETVVAILTILGYSLYDTVVIFDKVKENTEVASIVARETYSGAVNKALNQVMVRSINTSITTLVPIGALLFFGGETLQNFAFALFVGVAVGTYSSIFVAAPVLSVLKEREPKLQQIRARAERRGPRPSLRPAEEEGPLQPATAPAATQPAATPLAEPVRERRPTVVKPGQPRPRKPKKKPRSKRRRR
jgi:preprotein translocase subunit SecF